MSRAGRTWQSTRGKVVRRAGDPAEGELAAQQTRAGRCHAKWHVCCFVERLDFNTPNLNPHCSRRTSAGQRKESNHRQCSRDTLTCCAPNVRFVSADTVGPSLYAT